jgi:hypothetical protein
MVLNTSTDKKRVQSDTNILWNPMSHIIGVKDGGTYKYRGEDNVIDQFIVSEALIDNSGLELVHESVKVLNNKKYRQSSGDYSGYPFRFWVGDSLLGGYSDHMAIMCTLKIK